MTQTSHLALIPRDGLFCKDGRGWHTSESGRGHSLDWPWPTTVQGAVRTAWGRGAEGKQGTPFTPKNWQGALSFRLARSLVLRRPHGGTDWVAAHRIWPSPADALFVRGRTDVFQLMPRERSADIGTLGRDDDPAREKLCFPFVDESDKPVSAPRWWSEDAFTSWLKGQPVTVDAARILGMVERRMQSHVGINADTFTAAESILFAHDVIETLDKTGEWAIGAEVDGPETLALCSATLGGDARLVRVETLQKNLFAVPDALKAEFKAKLPKGLRLVVVTPTQFEHGWLPDGFVTCGTEYKGELCGIAGKLILRAAFVGRPLHISGWDLAKRAAKPTVRLVPPGATYFFERADKTAFTEKDVETLWLTALGNNRDGFGRVVPGIWHTETKKS